MARKQDVAAKVHDALCTKIAVVAVNKLTRRNINVLKANQVKALYQATRSDVLVTLPTGYGKSLIFELLPHFIHFSTNQKSAVIIVSPLNAIVNEKLHMYGESACHVSKSMVDELNSDQLAARSVPVNQILQGNFTYLLKVSMKRCYINPNDSRDLAYDCPAWRSKIRSGVEHYEEQHISYAIQKCLQCKERVRSPGQQLHPCPWCKQQFRALI